MCEGPGRPGARLQRPNQFPAKTVRSADDIWVAAVRDWSLITERGGGGGTKRKGRGEVLPLQKGGRTNFSHAERGGAQKVVG